MNHYERRIKELKDKFKLQDGLQVVGMDRPKEKTLEDFVTDKEREASKEMKIATGSTTYKGRPLRLWYTITR